MYLALVNSSRKRDDVIDRQPDPDLLADRVIVVRWDERQHSRSRGEFQRI